MSYAWLQWLPARKALLDRLASQHDSSGFWKDPECQLYLKEALRTWNAIAQFHRAQDTLTTVNGQVFYDLTTTLTGNSLQQTVTDTQLYSTILYQLMETPTPELAPSEMTEQFLGQDFVDAVTRRRDQFLLETGCFLTRSTPAVGGPPANGRVSLSDSIIDFRRVAFIQGSASVVPLFLTNEYSAGAWSTPWLTPGTTDSYSPYMVPHVGLTLMPPPSATGTLDLLTINAGTALTNPPTGLPTGTLLGIPDDWAWVVKWGAMADLLSGDGERHDAFRAKYCEQMWQQGVQFYSGAATVQNILIGTTPMPVSAIAAKDAWNPLWQQVVGTPTDAITAGLNLVAFSPVPNGVNTITLDVVTNAPIPASDTAFVQVSREQWSAILDYAEHLASFKCGGEEFMRTMPLAERFLRLAIQQNQRLAAQAFNFKWMQRLVTRQDVEKPSKKPVTEAA